MMKFPNVTNETPPTSPTFAPGSSQLMYTEISLLGG